MPDSPDQQRAKIRAVLQTLFPGKDNERLRDALLRLDGACGQLKYVGIAVRGAMASVKNKPMEEWERYMYDSLNDSVGWLSRLEMEMLDVGSELRFVMRAREAKKLEAEGRVAEAKYAKEDGQRYREHLFDLQKKAEVADGTSDTGTGRGVSGGPETGGGGGAGPPDRGHGGGVEDPQAKPTGLVDPERRRDGSDALGEARRILGR